MKDGAIQKGSITELVRKGRAIQSHIPKSHPHSGEQQLVLSFAKLMFQRKIHAALQLLTDWSNNTVHYGGSEPMTVKYVLKSKHPLVGL